MKKKIEELAEKEAVDMTEKMITRKEAIKKAGYIAVSAATMMILLSSPSQAQASRPAPPPAASPSRQSCGGIWKKNN
jgi:hydroxyacyl-ACP dehydratase HTD2-like protein with hotdog domain